MEEEQLISYRALKIRANIFYIRRPVYLLFSGKPA